MLLNDRAYFEAIVINSHLHVDNLAKNTSQRAFFWTTKWQNGKLTGAMINLDLIQKGFQMKGNQLQPEFGAVINEP